MKTNILEKFIVNVTSFKINQESYVTVGEV